MLVAVRLRISPSHNGLLLPATGFAKSHSPHHCFQLVPSHTLKQEVVVLKINKPIAGFTIAFRSAMVILGINAPFVVELASNIADGSGGAPEGLTPTPWAFTF